MKRAKFSITNPHSRKVIILQLTPIKWDLPICMQMENSSKTSTHSISNKSSKEIVKQFSLKEINPMEWVRRVLADKTLFLLMETLYFNRMKGDLVHLLHKWIRKIYSKINPSILWRAKAMLLHPQEARGAIHRREKDTCLHLNLLSLYSQNTSI